MHCRCVGTFEYECREEVGEDSGALLSESELKETNVMYISSLW